MSYDSKILCVSDDNAIEKQVWSTIQEYPNVDKIAPEEVKAEINRIAPDIVVLVQPSNGSEVDLTQYIINESTTQLIFFIADSQDFQLLREVTRAGISDYFVLPHEMSQFQDRLEKMVHVFQEQLTAESHTAATGQVLRKGRGHVYSFFSAKGGVGRTLLSTAFSQTLQFESTAQVVIIDLNMQYGGVETFLDVESNRSIVDLKPVIQELNENHIRNVSEKEKYSKLELLLSPRDAETAEQITEDDIAQIIRVCRRTYDFVILDLPAEMNTITYTALEESDMIYYIMKLDTPSIKVLKRVEELFQRLGMNTKDRIELIINEKDRSNELKASDLTNFVSVPTGAEIRRDLTGVQAAVNKGDPLRKNTKDKKMTMTAKDIRKWVLSKLK